MPTAPSTSTPDDDSSSRSTGETAESTGPGPHNPSIPDDADQDVPFEGPSDVQTVKVTDPDGAHRRGMDRAKLSFGMKLIASSLTIYVLLSVVQYATQNLLSNAAALTSAMDLLKLIATTALGFVFGRTLDNDKKE